MSEPVAPATALPVLFSRDARPPAVPGRAPAQRHKPLPGLAGFDWQLRHHFVLRREESFLAAALQSTTDNAAALPAAPGDISAARAAAALTDACTAAGITADPLLRRRVLALLRGCYVVMPPVERQQAVALAAAAAARCGLSVHLACEGKEVAEALPPLVEAALAGSDLAVHVLNETSNDLTLLSGRGAGVVCTTASTFAHAWLRWGGETAALARAAAWLGGATVPVFSHASLLLCPDGERVLLDLLRHPLQITRAQSEDAPALIAQLVELTAAWQDGVEFAGKEPSPRGEAVLRAEAEQQGGLWAVPKLRDAFLRALLIARSCKPEQDFVLENGRVRWLVAPDTLAADATQQAQVELALRCLQGQGATQRVRRRAWFTDFFAGYARIGAAGENLGNEWRDLWWLHAMPVLDNTPRRIEVTWIDGPLEAWLAQPDARIAVGQARLRELPGMPADALSLESREGLQELATLVAGGTPVCVLGAVAASRQLPPALSSIMLAADARLLPPPLAAVAQRAPRLGPVGRLLRRLIGAWLLRQAAAQRFRLRRSLVQRQQQERRTYAFTGDGRDD
ncbi:MAG: hypothetical protein ACOY41_07710 [Pseudomonadota bacterium]